jgi:predicted TIM-barrel fold metal-dependent hydrolase
MSIPIIDTHQHLVYPERSSYPWMAGIPSLAGRPYRIEDYFSAAQETGIEASVFMETTPDAWREEAGHVYQMAADPSTGMIGVIAGCHPEDEGFPEYLESIQNPMLVGLRRVCHLEPDGFSQQPGFVENVRRIGESRLTFDLCFLGRQLALAYELAASCPGTQFVLDHCGVPDIAGGVFESWREGMRKFASLPNVACKVSGVLAYCAPWNATLDSVRPYIEQTIEFFGWDRVLWGSDWPVCTITSTLREWVSISRSIVSSATDSEQRKLFRENAIRI